MVVRDSNIQTQKFQAIFKSLLKAATNFTSLCFSCFTCKAVLKLSLHLDFLPCFCPSPCDPFEASVPAETCGVSDTENVTSAGHRESFILFRQSALLRFTLINSCEASNFFDNSESSM